MADRRAAEVFAAKLGIEGPAFQTLLVPSVDIAVDKEGDSIPATVKKAWWKWCLIGHPDKGGDEATFQGMQGEYASFKSWFHVHREDITGVRGARDRCEVLGQQLKSGEEAKNNAANALVEKKYEDAIRFAKDAKQRYQEYVTEQGAEAGERLLSDMKHITKIREEAEEHIRALEEERKQTEERLETERKQREEHQTLLEGLDSFANKVGSTADGNLTVSEKIRDVSNRIQSYVSDLNRVRDEIEGMKLENHRLWQELEQTKEEKKEIIAAIKEGDDDNGNFFKWLSGSKPRSRLVQQVAAAQEDRRNIRRGNNRLQSENQKLSAENEAKDEQIKQLADRNEDLTVVLREHIEDSKRTLEEQKLQYDCLRVEHDELAEEKRRVEQERDTCVHDLRLLQGENQKLSGENEAKDKQIKQLADRNEDLTVVLREHIEDSKRTLEEQKLQYDCLRVEHDELAEEKRRVEQERDTCVHDLRTEVCKCESHINKLKKENEVSKRELEECKFQWKNETVVTESEVVRNRMDCDLEELLHTHKLGMTVSPLREMGVQGLETLQLLEDHDLDELVKQGLLQKMTARLLKKELPELIYALNQQRSETEVKQEEEGRLVGDRGD